MAPEVVTDGHADPRSDIYSLGVVLFEAATGRLPFYGDSPYQLMRQHVDSRRRARARWCPTCRRRSTRRSRARWPRIRSIASRPPTIWRARCGGVAPAAASARWSGADGGAGAARLPALRRLGGRRGRRSAPTAAWRCCASTTERAASPCWSPARASRRQARRPRQVALFKLLDELPSGPSRSGRGRRRAPRVPFFVARGISPAVREAAGAPPHGIEPMRASSRGLALAPPAVRQKLWRTTYRPLAGSSASLPSGPLTVPAGDWGVHRLSGAHRVSLALSAWGMSSWRRRSAARARSRSRPSDARRRSPRDDGDSPGRSRVSRAGKTAGWSRTSSSGSRRTEGAGPRADVADALADRAAQVRTALAASDDRREMPTRRSPARSGARARGAAARGDDARACCAPICCGRRAGSTGSCLGARARRTPPSRLDARIGTASEQEIPRCWGWRSNRWSRAGGLCSPRQSR